MLIGVFLNKIASLSIQQHIYYGDVLSVIIFYIIKCTIAFSYRKDCAGVKL